MIGAMEPQPPDLFLDPAPEAASTLPPAGAATEGISARSRPPGVWVQLREFLDMIKFEHTVFALPFAFLGAFEAARGVPSRATLLWILMAMVGARTAAMSYNRIVDADIDAENPRTRSRALPAGRVTAGFAWLLLGAACALLGFAAGMLGPLPWKLAPLALFIILGYSLCKRFTSWSHAVLGLSLAGAPLGAWIAVCGRVESPAWFLSLGVLAWTAGFDILYALQDRDFDEARGLHSIPARLGVGRALWVSRGFHLLALLFWGLFEWQIGSHLFPWLAWAAVAVILGREQWLMRRGSLERLDHAFFTLNSLVGLIFLGGHLLQGIQAWCQS